MYVEFRVLCTSKEFFANVKHVKQNLYVIKLIDEKRLKSRLKENAGIRTIIDEMTNELRNTNKNFKSEGVRRIILSENELFTFVRFFRIKKLLNAAHQSYLFQQLDQSGNDPAKRNIMGKWSKYLERHLNLEVPINTNAWRKSMCTIFAQKLEDVQIERSLDRHIGHSRNVAQKHYEMIQKEMDACETSNAVDRIIKVSEETEDQIKTVAAQAEEINEDDDLSESSDEENQISSENDSCSDYSSGEDKKSPAKNKKAPLKVNLPLGSSLGIKDGIPPRVHFVLF